jgi:hypothetical protein
LEIFSLCPFPASAFLWEAQPGQFSLTVLVKATFALLPGEATVAPEQEPLGEERHWDHNGLASLYWPGDFAPVKRRVDVTLVGHAHAPGGRAVTSLTARLTVGDLVKAVKVTGDRVWSRGEGGKLAPGAPQPFVRLPLRYERAALSADNPVGIDPNAPPVPGAPALPNLERAEGAGAACFGPVASSWRARRRLLDEGSLFWAHGIARDRNADAPPLGAAPPRFNFEFFNAAARDQQIDILRPGATIVLENLDPEHPRLETRLPAHRPQVFRVPPPDVNKGRVEEIIVRCDSLWIDVDRGVAVVAWRGLADVAGGDLSRVGRLVIAADPEGKKLRWERVERRLREEHPPTVRLEKAGEARPATGPSAGDLDDEAPPDPLAVRYDGRKGPPEAPAIPAPSVAIRALPEPPASIISDETTNRLDPPAGPAALVTDDDRTQALETYLSGEAAPDSSPQSTLVMTRPAAAPAAKTLLSPSKPTFPRPSVPTAPSAPLSLERYGAISAELARRDANRAGILAAHHLTEAAWVAAESRWKQAIAADDERGDRALLAAFDAAYVAAQERREPPLGVAEFARIQVGLERNEVGRVLAELDLQLGDLMRLQRVWAKRLAGSPALADELAQAVEAARWGTT